MSDLLAEMQRMRDEVLAGAPFPLAVRLHPADASTLRHGYTPSQAEMAFAPQLFVSAKVERGKVELAYTREEVKRWQEEES